MFNETSIDICYLDESGDEQPLTAPGQSKIFAIGGFLVSTDSADALLMDFLRLKQRTFSQLARPGVRLSDLITHEVKGAQLRRDLREGTRWSVHTAMSFLDQFLTLLEKHGAKLVGQNYVKSDSSLSRYAYSMSVQQMIRRVDKSYGSRRTKMLVVMDSRTKSKNTPTVRHLATQKFKSGSSDYQRLIETPVFGHSDAHPLIQIADIVVSALLVPLAEATFFSPELAPHHGYTRAKSIFANRLDALQLRSVVETDGSLRGIAVRNFQNDKRVAGLFNI